MRKPRDIWTAEEREEIDTRALAAMQRMAALGDYVSFEVCQDLAQLGLMRRKLDEIEKWMDEVGI